MSNFGAVFALDHYRFTCTCAIKQNVPPQASTKTSVKVVAFSLLIRITLEKNPHACFLTSISTKTEQLRTEHHYLNCGF